ncbi:hypothetical protein M758_8G125700 [Ceratodon purpureus]|nr:hypothetical protein M758_8G125700 [Ceratodon purpureus]
MMTSLWKLRVLSRCLAVQNLVRRKDGTLNRRPVDIVEWLLSVNTKVVDGVATFDEVVDSATGVWVRLFVPTQKTEVGTSGNGKKMPVVIYHHGGGFVFFQPNTVVYDQFCRRLARECHAVVISVHYRRAPEHKLPTAYDDSYSVLEWLNSEKSEKHLPSNVDLSRVFLAGDSAGGNIVHHVAIQAAGKSLDRLTLKGLLLIQPFFGGEERTPIEVREKDPLIITQELTDWFWKAYLPPGSNRDHPASNVFGPHSNDISNVPVPPVAMFVGGRDILKDWEMRYAEDMKKAGKRVQVLYYEDGIHLMCHFNQAGVAEQMMSDIVSFIENH